MSTGWMIIDGAIVLLLIGMAIARGKDGFAKSVVSFFGIFISAGAAAVASGFLSKTLFSALVRPRIMDMTSQLGRMPKRGGNINITQALKSVPSILLTLLENKFGSSYPTLITDAITKQKDPSTYLADKIVGPAVIPVMATLIFLVLFIIILLVVRLIAKLMKKLNDVPVAGFFNRLGGAFFGFLEACIVLMVIMKLIEILFILNHGEGMLLTPSLIRKTYLFRLLQYYNPVTMLIELIG